jgi:hypothetical protein
MIKNKLLQFNFIIHFLLRNVNKKFAYFFEIDYNNIIKIERSFENDSW